MRNVIRFVCSSLVLLAWSGAASAADLKGPPFHRRPYAAVRVIGVGSPDMFGASGSLYVPRPFVLEGGVSRGLGQRGSWYARGGVALSLRERQTPADVVRDQKYPDDRYPTYDVIVQPMGGFRWYETQVDGVSNTFQGPTFNTAVDFMVWVNAKTALDFQLAIGGSYWLEQSDPDALSFMPDVHLAAGFAF